jgi:hypothetical protein
MQVSYDATYISPTPVPAQPAPRLGTPPRATSLKPTPGALHAPPSIFPLNTPNPTPVTTEQDRRYVRAEGVTLVSGTWGEPTDPARARLVEDRDAFALLWDETVGVWVAVYRMCINVGAWCPLIPYWISHTVCSLLAGTLTRPIALSYSVDYRAGETSAHDTCKERACRNASRSRGLSQVTRICKRGTVHQRTGVREVLSRSGRG